MTCPACNSKNVYNIRFYGDGKGYCKFCPQYKPKSINGLFIRAVNPGSVGKRTVAHDQDISRRRLAEDGHTVVRI